MQDVSIFLSFRQKQRSLKNITLIFPIFYKESYLKLKLKRNWKFQKYLLINLKLIKFFMRWIHILVIKKKYVELASYQLKDYSVEIYFGKDKPYISLVKKKMFQMI
jgi:hypothetical protein